MKTTVTLLVCVLLILNGCSDTNKTISPDNLRTEYRVDPIGIDTPSPRFTWNYSAAEGSKSTISRTEIYIGTHPDKLALYQESMSFEPHTRYYWMVKAWDDKGRLRNGDF